MTTSVFSSNRTTVFWYVSIYACFDGFRQHRASTSRVSRGSLRLWVFTRTRIWDIQPLFTIFLSTTACTASAVVLHGGSCKCVLRKQVFNGLNRKGAFIEFLVRCHPWCFVGLLQQQIIYTFVLRFPGALQACALVKASDLRAPLPGIPPPIQPVLWGTSMKAWAMHFHRVTLSAASYKTCRIYVLGKHD